MTYSSMNRLFPLLLLILTLVASRDAQPADDLRVARCEETDNPRPFSRPGATRIAITDFDVTGRGAAPEDGARIADLLCRALDTMVEVELRKEQIFIPPSDLEIVRVPRPIRTFSEGRVLGQDLGSDVVLWGDGSCEIPKGELLLKASDEASRAVAGSVHARGYEKITVEATGGGTAVGGDLDVEALNLYSVCTRAALVSWDLVGKSTSTDNLSMLELQDLPLGSFTVGEPQAVLDLVLALHFAYRRSPLQADHFLSSVRDAVAARPDLMALAIWIAKIDDDLGRKEDARRQLDEILQTTRAIGDKSLEATALNNIGGVYSALGDQERALEFYEQALPILRAIGNHSGEGAVLNNIGWVYATLEDPKRALKFYKRALSILRIVGDRSGEATTLNNIGLAYAALDDPKRALKFYKRALPILRIVGDRSDEATTLNNIGLVYYDLGDPKSALEFHEQALPILHAVGNRYGEATTLNNIGGVYADLGDPRRALELYVQALPIRKAVGDRSGEGVTLNNLGLVYADLGDPKRALELYVQALSIRRAIGDRSGEATTLFNTGSVYFALGDTQRALELSEQALPIFRSIGDRSGEATALNSIGREYEALGDPQRALEFYEQALAISHAVGDRSGEARSLNNLGLAHASLGDSKRALKFYRRALPISRAVGSRSGEATTLYNFGRVYDNLGDPKRALDFYDQALPLQRAVGNPERLNATLFHMGLAKVSLKSVESGVNDLEEAARISCSVQHSDCMPDIRVWYGVAREHGQAEAAKRALPLAVQLAGDPTPPIVIAALRRLAQPPDLGGQGMLITEVLPSSNAMRSGLLAYDILVRYDGEPVDETNTFIACIQATSGRAEPVPVVLIRGDQVIRQSVEPGLLGVRAEAVP